MPNLRDLLTLAGMPGLHSMVQRARSLGLETLLDYQRLSILVAAVRATRHLEGQVIEFGSYKGGSAAVIGQALKSSKRILYVCDSFRGLDKPTPEDNYHREGTFSDTGEEAVRRGLDNLGIDFEIHAGFFRESLPGLAHLRLSLAHIDADLYQAVKETLEFSYPRMPEGAIIILDDYGCPRCHGARTAADEFFSGKPEKPEPLSGSAYGIIKGGTGLLDRLRREAGWFFSLPLAGSAIFRGQPQTTVPGSKI